jgi:anti-sigma regulatory factor (Ser/Thr protein kinase)
MSLIGVISGDKEQNEVIASEFAKDKTESFILQFPENEKAALEFLNFDLPEIVIVNFSDDTFDLATLLDSIKQDTWLHTFGIIGIYDHASHNEDEVLSEHSDLNILAMLDVYRLRSHLLACAQIIEQNRQIIFQRDLEEKLLDKASSAFSIKNDLLATSVYASIAATTLLQRGYIRPDAKMHLQLCIAELLVNAVEHGNCGINFDEKTEALDNGISMMELVEQKCQDPAIGRKRVHFEWEIQQDYTKFLIQDEGDGFDVLGLKEKIEKEGPYSLHGRGVKLARHFAKKLMYNEKGNIVIIIIEHDKTAVKNAPVGFSGEEILTVNKGDIIFQEGESSDFLYYIASGNFSVYHNAARVGTLGPEDLFMGEMSFLLNNRRSAKVVADTEGRLVKITRRSFISVIKDYPHYGIFLSKLLARKLVRANIRNSEFPEPEP